VGGQKEREAAALAIDLHSRHILLERNNGKDIQLVKHTQEDMCGLTLVSSVIILSHIS
jgi:hypothetical protein